MKKGDLKKLGKKLTKKLAGTQPLFIAVMNDSFIFYSDLIRQIELDITCEFIYLGKPSTKPPELKDKVVVYVFGKKPKKEWKALKASTLKAGAVSSFAVSPTSVHF